MSALKKPKPRVKVITWSKQMNLKRRYEVQIVTAEGSDQFEDDIAIQRYAKIEDANAHAEVLKKALAWRPPA